MSMTNDMPVREARAARPDAIICTGRSDYPNQVNNVLCFPFIFRGALDVGATTINEAMKHAAVDASAELAHAELSDVVANAYREPDEWIVVVTEDDDLIPSVYVAEAALVGSGARVVMLRNRTGTSMMNLDDLLG